jgi:predicted negative regulator of RcsB-dependent stress response
MDYETEEQQLEAIKSWWKENGTMVIAGIVLGLGAIFGWRYYSDYQQQQAQLASSLYDTVLQAAMVNGDIDEQQTRVNRLLGEFAGTPYAGLSALVLAKQQLARGEMAQARQQLEWVINNADRPEIKHIARLRLMRVLFASENYDEALALANIDYPESFAALYEELKGDLYTARGELDKARAAYDSAILHSPDQANRWLRLKRDDLGNVTRTEPAA